MLNVKLLQRILAGTLRGRAEQMAVHVSSFSALHTVPVIIVQGLAATMQYVEIVYAELWGVLIFDENPPWQSICGAGLVMCCAIITLLKKKQPAK
jgi:drug/metabolite transporter (DMT)-like permease